jgi:hypothetical protein
MVDYLIFGLEKLISCYENKAFAALESAARNRKSWRGLVPSKSRKMTVSIRRFA